MNIGRTENRKQNEYLMNIRDVGMGIIYGQTTPEVFIDTFERYIDYIDVPSRYLQTLKEVSSLINDGRCSPDELLLKMGRHCPEIRFDKPDVCGVDGCDCCDDYDDCDDYDGCDGCDGYDGYDGCDGCDGCDGLIVLSKEDAMRLLGLDD